MQMVLREFTSGPERSQEMDIIYLPISNTSGGSQSREFHPFNPIIVPNKTHTYRIWFVELYIPCTRLKKLKFLQRVQVSCYFLKRNPHYFLGLGYLHIDVSIWKLIPDTEWALQSSTMIHSVYQTKCFLNKWLYLGIELTNWIAINTS